MKRMHVGLEVADLKASCDFYRRLFGCPPTMEPVRPPNTPPVLARRQGA